MPRGKRARTLSGSELVNSALCESYLADQATIAEGVPLPAAEDAFDRPAEYYASMSRLVIAEAKECVRDGLAARGRRGGFDVSVTGSVAAAERGSRRLAALLFSPTSPSTAVMATLRPGGVFELKPPRAPALLAVVDGRTCGGGASMAFEVLDAALRGVALDGKWRARAVASVLLEQRCADVCQRAPRPPFLQQLLGCKQRVHLRFGGGGDDSSADGESAAAQVTAALPRGGGDGGGGGGGELALDGAADASDGTGGAADAGLNDLQRAAVRRALAGESCTLLQGPPGTLQHTLQHIAGS